MTFLRLILVLAIAGSAFGAGKMPAAQKADGHSCCKSKQSPDQKDQDTKHDCGTCLMVCCRIVTAPADPVTTPLDESPLAVRIFLPPLLADDVGEPQ